MLSFGLAFPLFFAPAMVLYMTALLPAIGLLIVGASRKVAGLVAILAVVLTAVVPPLLAKHAAQRDAASVAVTEIKSKLANFPQSLEIHIPATFYGGPNDALRTAPCERLCQELLLTKQTAAIRVVAIISSKPTGAVIYRFKELASCPKAFADESIILEEVKRAASYGKCLTASPGANMTADVKLVKTAVTHDRTSGTFYHVPRETVTYQLSQRVYGSWFARSKLVEFSTAVIQMPLFPSFEGAGELRLRPAWMRSVETFNALTPRNVLEQTTKVKLSEVPAIKPEEPVEFVKRVLARNGTEPFGAEIMGPINTYLQSLSQSNALAPQDETILHTLLRDKRVMNQLYVMLVLERHPDVVSPVISDILAKLEVPVDESQGHNHNHLAWMLVRSPIQGLLPYSERILGIAATSDQWHLSPLLTVAGRLSVDGTELLSKRLHASSWTTRSAAVRGVCGALPDRKRRLIPQLQTILEIYGGRDHSGNDDLELALAALKQAGRADEVERYLAKSSEAERKILSARLENLTC
jgi:hypothetical protein